MVKLLSTTILLLVALIARSASAEDQLPFAITKDPSKLPARAIIQTTEGSFTIKLFRQQAPISVQNFEYLARKGTYNYVKFHKLIEGFAIQGGDPTGSGWGGPGYTLPPEFGVKHLRGTLGWARPPMRNNPERRSSGSQFYICLIDAPHLDEFYTAFAQVVRGMDVVDKLRVGDRIQKVTFPDDPPGAKEEEVEELPLRNKRLEERLEGMTTP